MTLTPDLIRQVQEAGRRRQKLNAVERARRELAPFVDTGSLTDDEVKALLVYYRDARAEEQPDARI